MLGVLDIPYCQSLWETLTLYPEGLHYLEQFTCREFCVGYFQISKIFKDEYIECGGRDTKVTYCFSFLGGNFTCLFFYQSSVKHCMPSLSGLFQDTPVAFFCLCRFLFRQPFNPNFLQVLIPYSAVIMLIFPTLAYIKVSAYALL